MDTRNHRTPGALKETLELRLAKLRVDTTGITIDVQGSTLILTGQLSHEKDRNVILSCLLEGALPERVVDSLHVAGKIPSTHVYMTQGEALSRTIKQHFNETLTWEQ